MSTPGPSEIERIEPHAGGIAQRLNWLRAGVLGANDGIVSTAAVAVGVAGATADRAPVFLAGIESADEAVLRSFADAIARPRYPLYLDLPRPRTHLGQIMRRLHPHQRSARTPSRSGSPAIGARRDGRRD